MILAITITAVTLAALLGIAIAAMLSEGVRQPKPVPVPAQRLGRGR